MLSLGKENVLIWIFFRNRDLDSCLPCVCSFKPALAALQQLGGLQVVPLPVCVVWCLTAKLESNLSNALCPHRHSGQQPSCSCLCVQVQLHHSCPWSAESSLGALSVGPELKQLRSCRDVPLLLLSLRNSGIIRVHRIRVHSCSKANWIWFLASGLCFMNSGIESPFQKHWNMCFVCFNYKFNSLPFLPKLNQLVEVSQHRLLSGSMCMCSRSRVALTVVSLL